MKTININRRDVIWICVVCVVSMSAYLLPGLLSGGNGYPLDDAWIHQTYARNLAITHQWAYFPGNTTNGSTAPLWTFLLSLGYFLNFSPLLWSYLWGGLFLIGTGICARILLRDLFPKLERLTLIAALLLVGEWHLVWASVSGMETILMVFCIVAFFLMTVLKQKNWLLMGLWIGLMIWIRPDAVTLAGPAGVILIMGMGSAKEKVINGGKLLAGILAFFIPYLLFNKTFSGSWMPNTFYAKQAEYAILLSQNGFVRLGLAVFQPLIGGGALLLPGLFYKLYQLVKTRSWIGLSWFTWWLGYSILYAAVLPVAYQHGRYQMPAMPVFWILGLWGILEIIAKYWRKKKWAVPVKAWGFSILAIWAAFLFLGVKAYSDDVMVIQTEMVAPSQWIATHTLPDALIAAHDIGALGYFGGHKLIDLAGLVTPEIIPIIRNEKELGLYLDTHGADYLMTFPGWYLDLAKGKDKAYDSNEQGGSAVSADPMTVYYWKIQK